MNCIILMKSVILGKDETKWADALEFYEVESE